MLNKYILNKTIINNLLVVVFTFNCIFIPYDNFELKMISLILLFIINFKDYLDFTSKDEFIIFLFGLILTTFNIIYSIILTSGNIFINVQQGYAPYILLLYPILKKNKIPFDKIFITLLKFLSYFIVGMVILDLLGIVTIYENNLLMWYHESQNAMIGKGNVFDFGYMMFIKTTPMIIVSIPFFIKNKQWMNSLVACLAMILSGTRANFLVAISVFIICIIFYLYNKFDKRKFELIFFVFFISILIILFKIDFFNFLKEMFISKADNDAIRQTSLNSMIIEWKANPISFFIGSGYSSEFYDIGLGKYTYITELSYWNLLRQVGLISFSFIMAMFLCPVYYLLKYRKFITIAIAFLGYLAIAYTNPLLYTSTGLCTLLFMYYFCFSNCIETQKKLPFSLKDLFQLKKNKFY